jgi:hypothetical protein
MVKEFSYSFAIGSAFILSAVVAQTTFIGSAMAISKDRERGATTRDAEREYPPGPGPGGGVIMERDIPPGPEPDQEREFPPGPGPGGGVTMERDIPPGTQRERAPTGRGPRTKREQMNEGQREKSPMTRTRGINNRGGQTRARVIKKADVDRVIGRWEERPREVAREMINKYGLPNEATQNRLTWHDNDPWARTEVLSEEYDHRFPENHTDVLIQTVNYEVPADKVDDLIQFHGGLVVKRTKGTLSVLCGNEEMNILALNLADDIIADKLTVEEARDVYAEQATAVMKGEPAPLTEELQFEPSMEATDPDQPAEKGFIERAREVLGLD